MVSMSMMRRRRSLLIVTMILMKLAIVTPILVANTTCHYWGEFAVSQLIADNAGGYAETPTTHESIKNKLLVRHIDC